jgi:hypothetical protein
MGSALAAIRLKMRPVERRKISDEEIIDHARSAIKIHIALHHQIATFCNECTVRPSSFLGAHPPRNESFTTPPATCGFNTVA